MNPLAWILDSIKVHPEPVSIPDVSDLTPIELAEIRSRLQTFAQVSTDLRRLVDVEIANRSVAFRYGDDVYRPSNGRGTAKVSDPQAFWLIVAQALYEMNQAEEIALFLDAMFPANSVRLTALPKLAAEVDVSVEGLKDTFIAYDPPTSLLSVMPLSKAPKFLADLEDGEIREVI